MQLKQETTSVIPAKQETIIPEHAHGPPSRQVFPDNVTAKSSDIFPDNLNSMETEVSVNHTAEIQVNEFAEFKVLLSAH